MTATGRRRLPIQRLDHPRRTTSGGHFSQPVLLRIGGGNQAL